MQLIADRMQEYMGKISSMDNLQHNLKYIH